MDALFKRKNCELFHKCIILPTTLLYYIEKGTDSEYVYGGVVEFMKFLHSIFVINNMYTSLCRYHFPLSASLRRVLQYCCIDFLFISCCELVNLVPIFVEQECRHSSHLHNKQNDKSLYINLQRLIEVFLHAIM